MVCRDHLRLLEEFESASLSCEHMRNSILVGNQSEFTIPQRRQLLSARQGAINALYDHSLWCEKCRVTSHPVKREAKQSLPPRKMRVVRTSTRKALERGAIADPEKGTPDSGQGGSPSLKPYLIQTEIRGEN
jgi:hypothetical protein